MDYSYRLKFIKDNLQYKLNFYYLRSFSGYSPGSFQCSHHKIVFSNTSAVYVKTCEMSFPENIVNKHLLISTESDDEVS